MTNDAGKFRIEVADKEGKYRAFVPESTAGADTCNQTKSSVVQHDG